MQTRRSFLRGSVVTAGGAALALSPGANALAHRRRRFGRLIEDRNGLLDLPRGFSYRVVQTADDKLSNGAPVPGDFDGMVALPGPRNTTLLVRNHELTPRDKTAVPQENPYLKDAPGGTTALLLHPNAKVLRSYVTSSGTLNNCAGGGTPWGTWLTCEESRTTNHGYVFEVDPRNPENKRSKTPIRDMGFFSHEAVDVDPRTGIFYLTEDDFRGDQVDPEDEKPGTTRSSFLYRYLPNDRRPRPGALQRGGKLQAMAIQARPQYNMDLGITRERFQIAWVDVKAGDPHADALEKGAARFQRLEGCHFAGGAFWFNDTSGGEERHGQVFRLIPSGDPTGGGIDTLELFLEGDSKREMDSPDNLVVTPWGDVWLAEDGDGFQRVMGITPYGDTYEFARNRLVGNDITDPGPTNEGTASELAGPTFSPDGRTFFVNIQSPAHTFAITGPFPRRDAGRVRRMAVANPSHPWAPKVSGHQRETAEKNGMSAYEVAAFERLGVAVA